MLIRILVTVCLEGFAVLTALLHSHLGVHTDEAKYLLNIPYPHPPLLRFFMGLTDGWAHQEIFWRILIASFLVQGVWLVWDMGRSLTRERRMTLCGLWLFSGALLVQSGTVIMAPVTAVQALFLCWALTRPSFIARYSGLIALLWLEMLFTAYQGVLFFPLVYACLVRAGLPLTRRVAVLVIPMALLALYTLTNPLAIASMGFAGTMTAGMPLADAVTRVVSVWLIGGSVILSMLGLWGTIRDRDLLLMLTLGFVTVFIYVAFRGYYAILFTPLLIAGIAPHSRGTQAWMPLESKWFRSSLTAFLLALQMLIGIAMFIHIPFPTYSTARSVGQELKRSNVTGTVLIAGSFGHEWQYWMPGAVERYRLDALADAVAVVCRSGETCTEADRRTMDDLGFRLWPGYGDEVWVRRN